MSRPADDDQSRFARNNRATYELHHRAGERTSVLFCTYKYETASEILLGGSIYPAMQSFLLAARALGLGTCITSWASYGGEETLREAVGIPGEWLLAGHVVMGWPRGNHGPVRRRPRGDAVDLDHWDAPAVELAGERTPDADFDVLLFRLQAPRLTPLPLRPHPAYLSHTTGFRRPWNTSCGSRPPPRQPVLDTTGFRNPGTQVADLGGQRGSIGGTWRVRSSSSPRALVSDRASPSRPVEHQRPAHVAVERVLGGEADAGEHLLAVAGDGAGAAAGDGLGHGRGERRAVVPRRVERGVGRLDGHVGSRPAGGGRPGRRRWAAELDALEGVRRGPARASPATRPTSSWARARWPAATASAQRPRRRRRAATAPSAGDRDQPERGSRPATGRRVERRRRSPRRCGAVVGDDQRTGRVPMRRRGRGRGRRAADVPDRPGGSTGAERRGGPRRRGRRARRARAPATDVERRRGACAAAPWSSNSAATAACGSRRGRRASPARRARRRAPRPCADAVAWRELRCEELALLARPSSVGPEVEQAAGDDVALDLGAAAVDRRGPGVEVLATATARWRRRRRAARRRPGRRRRGRTPPARRWPAASCRSTSRARACRRRPAGAGWRGTGPGRRRAAGTPRPPRPGRSAPGAAPASSCSSAPVQEGAAVPERGAALVGQQVHGHRPALALVAERAVDGHDARRRRTPRRTPRAPWIASIGRTVMPGRVHVDEQGGDAPVGRLGRAGAGRAGRSAGRTGRGSSTPSGR